MRQNFFCILVSVSAYALVLADATTKSAPPAAPAPGEPIVKKHKLKYYNKDGVEVKPSCPSCDVGGLSLGPKIAGLTVLVPVLGGLAFKAWTKYTDTGKQYQEKKNLE